MKKIIAIGFASLAGALIALALNSTLGHNDNAQDRRNVVQPTSEAIPIIRPVASVPASLDFTGAAARAVDGVVHIKSTIGSGYASSYDPWRDFFFGSPAPREAIASGSGVILSADGYIVTNNHVIDKANKVVVTLNDKRAFDATVVGRDPSSDLALLHIDVEGLKYIPFGNSDNVKVGEWALAVGNPFNLTSTVTAGIISAKGRDINILSNDPASGLPPIESFIQTDAAVNPGNSGGALVNANGELIGINAAIESNTGSYTGYSFAIPVNIVQKVVNDIMEYGTVQRGFIGVSITDINDGLAKEKGLPTMDGVYVSGVMENSGGAKGGIKEGDVILKVADQKVHKASELQEKVSSFRPGDVVTIKVNRGGDVIDLPVTLTNKFGDTKLISKETSSVVEALGASFKQADSDLLKSLGLDHGVQVSALGSGKLRSAGIREGFIITKIDKQPIKDARNIAEILKNKDGGVLIEGIYPNGMKAYYGFGL